MITAAVGLPIFDPGGRAVSDKRVHCVDIMQTESMHDTAIITLRGADTSAPELQPGTPVQIQYGWGSVDFDFFYGYIDHIESHYQRAVSETAELEDVVCLGASYALKDPFTGAWSHIQASSLVAQVASKYFLSSVIETDDPLWPQLSSPGDSAWSFLTQLTSKQGYTLACNKTMIRFMSIDLSMKCYWSTMPVFQSRKVTPSYALQSIVQFEALTGEATSLNGNTKATRNVSGLNLQTGQLFNAVNRGTGSPAFGRTTVVPFFHQQVSDAVVSNQGHAADVLEGMYQDNRFTYQATAIISGLTAVRQGVPIMISGIDSNNDGTWWVQEAVHKIRRPGYTIAVSLGRDAKGSAGLLPSQGSSVAFSPANPFAYTIANAPPTTLVNNRWRAAHASNVALT